MLVDTAAFFRYDKGMKEEYVRTAMLIGEEKLNKLLSSHVLLFGLGGVGSFTAEALARAGVGALTLVDGDELSLSNINRQLYALHSTVGIKKTEAAKQRILDINPDCRVETIPEFVTPENIGAFFGGSFDFCADAIDDTAAKTAIAVECDRKNIPLIAAMGTGCKRSSANFRVTDIYKTEYCPLCRTMRKKYKDAGLDRVTVLFSPDERVPNAYDPGEDGRTPPSSISFVPSVAGLKIAEYIITKLTG